MDWFLLFNLLLMIVMPDLRLIESLRLFHTRSILMPWWWMLDHNLAFLLLRSYIFLLLLTILLLGLLDLNRQMLLITLILLMMIHLLLLLILSLCLLVLLMLLLLLELLLIDLLCLSMIISLRWRRRQAIIFLSILFLMSTSILKHNIQFRSCLPSFLETLI